VKLFELFRKENPSGSFLEHTKEVPNHRVTARITMAAPGQSRASNGSMGFVVILLLMQNADTMIACGAGGNESVNAANGKPALVPDA